MYEYIMEGIPPQKTRALGLSLKLKVLREFWKTLSEDGYRSWKANTIFEKNLAFYTGSKYAVGVTSGTNALIMSLKACGIMPGDEVIVPALGFVSAASAVSWMNADPIFVDVNKENFNIDVSKIESLCTPKTKAIIAVHVNGRMADMDSILEIASKRNLVTIADAAQAVGSRYKDRPIGGYGDMVCMSFGVTKSLCGYGDGGVLLTNNNTYFEQIRAMQLYGAQSWGDIYTENKIPGFVSRLNPLQAIVLNAKLPALEDIIGRQREHYFTYMEQLSGVGDISLPNEDQDYFINGYRFALLTQRRDALKRYLMDRGVSIKPYYDVPIHKLPLYIHTTKRNSELKVAEMISDSILVLPTDGTLPASYIERVISLIKLFFRQENRV